MSFVEQRLTFPAEHSRAKVDDLEGGQVIGGSQHEVGGLEVPVAHAHGVAALHHLQGITQQWTDDH